jgi:hypothetical protein
MNSAPSSDTSAMGNKASGSSDMASSDTPNSTDEMKKPHHRRHHMAKTDGSRPGESARTDDDANKLNACMVNANPTPTQENCLEQAERS